MTNGSNGSNGTHGANGASRVRHLHVSLDTPDPVDAGTLRTQLERGFVRAALEACERAVHERLGREAIVLVRRLSVRWSLGVALGGSTGLDGALADLKRAAALGEELGAELVADVERRGAARRLRPSPDDEVIVFRDEAHLRAAWLTDAREGRAGAWCYRRLDGERDVWAATCARGPAMLRAVLGYLARMESAAVVLGSLDDAAIAQALAVLPREQWPVPPPRAGARSTRDAEQVPRGRPTVDPRDRAFDGSEGSRGSEASEASPDRDRSPSVHTSADRHDAAAMLADTARAALRAQLPTVREAVRTAEASDSTSGMRALSDTSSARIDAGTDRSDAPLDARSHSPTANAPTTSDLLDTDGEPAPVRLATAWAGAFYLARLALELDLAEHLFCAGLREGDVLCHVVARLLGQGDATDGDPAPLIFGAHLDLRSPPLAPVADWAADEVWDKSRGALLAMCARRRLDAPSIDALTTTLDEIAAALAPTATPASPAIPDDRTDLLMRRLAAALLWAFQRRLDEPLRPDALRPHLAIDGVIVLGDESIEILMPMSAVDIRLRLAGLDFDPGWIPWLRRKLVLRFDRGADDT